MNCNLYDKHEEDDCLRDYAIITLLDDTVIACEISNDTRFGITFIKAIAPSDKCRQFEKYINPYAVSILEYVDENMAFLVARMLNVGPVMVLERRPGRVRQ